MVGVGDEVLVEELGEAELDEESEEQGDVIDAFVSQLDGGGGIHGGAPTKPWAWKGLGCTVADGSGGRSRRDTCKHRENGQYRQRQNSLLTIHLFRERRVYRYDGFREDRQEGHMRIGYARVSTEEQSLD